MMKAYVVDPEKKEIRVIDHDDSLNDLYELIQCTCVCTVTLNQWRDVVYLDDEGVESKDAVIIDKGVLKSFMHNKDSASYFDMELTGNARAFSYTDEPLVRMRNTAILPGKDKFEDMIASIENGYLLMRWTNGQADSTSEFMFGVQMGYEIKDGKLGRAITDTTISGVAFDMLKEITMLSDEMTWNCAGMCGKKQPMPVGMGGPAVKTKMFIGGE